MRKYDFESMGGIWEKEARKITEKGVLIAHSGNWDLWEYNGTVYSIPVIGSGAGASVWCSLSGLLAHLYRLRQICGYNTLIPTDWEDVNRDFLNGYGIA